MGGLQQKTSDKTGACLQKGSAEHGGYARGFTSVWITETGTVALPEEDGLLEILSRTVQDGRVISLVHKYLNAGVEVGHKFERTEAGVPQGGPLSVSVR